MYNLFIATLSPMMTMLFFIIVGFVVKKFKLLPDNADKVISRLETHILCPAIGFSVALKYGSPETYINNAPAIIYGALAIFFSIFISIPISKLFRMENKYQQGVYKYGLAIANYGYMGNAVVPMILGGDEHLFNYSMFTLVVSIMTYVWGLTILIPKEKRSKNKALSLLNPGLAGLLLGFLLSVTGVVKYIPDFAMTALSTLKDCMGPLAMLLTGIVIAGFSFKDMLTNKKVYIVSILRLFILPMILLALLRLLGADKYILTLALFAFATPIGLNTVVYPASFDEDTFTGAGMATISHALSIVSIPIMYALLNLVIK